MSSYPCLYCGKPYSTVDPVEWHTDSYLCKDCRPRKFKIDGSDKFGCIDDDRNVGPWREIRPNCWVRLGPKGYRNMFDNCVAHASFREDRPRRYGFAAYSVDGWYDESGYTCGNGDSSVTPEDHLQHMRDDIDATLRTFGWIVDGSTYVPPNMWERVKHFLGLS